MLGAFGNSRLLRPDEYRLLEALLAAAPGLSLQTLKSLRVQELNDSGMGSLRLLPEGLTTKQRVFGAVASECTFVDADGVEVFATLYLDKDKQLFELDMWKTDFSPLISIPEKINTCSPA